jgi:hypothetical protein
MAAREGHRPDLSSAIRRAPVDRLRRGTVPKQRLLAMVIAGGAILCISEGLSSVLADEGPAVGMPECTSAADCEYGQYCDPQGVCQTDTGTGSGGGCGVAIGRVPDGSLPQGLLILAALTSLALPRHRRGSRVLPRLMPHQAQP